MDLRAWLRSCIAFPLSPLMTKLSTTFSEKKNTLSVAHDEFNVTWINDVCIYKSKYVLKIIRITFVLGLKRPTLLISCPSLCPTVRYSKELARAQIATTLLYAKRIDKHAKVLFCFTSHLIVLFLSLFATRFSAEDVTMLEMVDVCC